MVVGRGPEAELVEKPLIRYLETLGYAYVSPEENETKRLRRNAVFFKEDCIAAIQRINGVERDVAESAFGELERTQDNEQFIQLLRQNTSRQVAGQSDAKTIRFVDFLKPENNTWQVTQQLYVEAQKSRIPDVVVYLNGIPIVVIEAKSPLSSQSKDGEAFEQIKQYERDIPRLFMTNLFNIVTDGRAKSEPLYGATGSPSKFWAVWRDPWPKKESDFHSPFEKGLYCLLEPSRLLDLLSHFIVFERRDNKVIKKMCRFQQYRAVNKMVDRVVDGLQNKGLIWHTQGSGKSLTMVFATLKLKYHHTINHPNLANPNILVLTDRRDLDVQISKTFAACGLPDPLVMRERSAGDNRSAKERLQDTLQSASRGQVVLSTIFLFEGSRQVVKNSVDWIVLVDECHRTQEKDLGAYMRQTLPEARYFGFTGTPVKSNDHDTYQNFGAPGEGYLDKYGIDDAVRDGATVPIRYTSRKAEFEVDDRKIDVVFDTWFSEEAPEVIAELKKRGSKFEYIVKHPRRIELIATDIWAHYRENLMPDGLKAQIVAIDREAVILYKRALDGEIAKHYRSNGKSAAEAEQLANAASVPVYSSSQSDDKPSEDPREQTVREGLRKYALGPDQERALTGDDSAFQKPGEAPYFLIVCNKLLTGFDAPAEAAMYLDNPLKEHSLLQAIARTNRVFNESKKYGLIVDYIGITKKLDEALETYRKEDVGQALLDVSVEYDTLEQTHANVMDWVGRVKRSNGPDKNQRSEYYELQKVIGTVDEWFRFRMSALAFIRAYETVSPDPVILRYTADFKWIVAALKFLAVVFEKEDSIDIRRFSGKIRNMIQEQLEVTGVKTLCKLRSITDPDFWRDFEAGPETHDEIEMRTVAARKAAELKRAVDDKMAENPVANEPFSKRVLELLRKYDEGLFSAAELIKEAEAACRDQQEKEKEFESLDISALAFGILGILRQQDLQSAEETSSNRTPDAPNKTSETDSRIMVLATEIAGFYERTFAGWSQKDSVCKELRRNSRIALHGARLFDKKAVKALPETIESFVMRHLR